MNLKKSEDSNLRRLEALSRQADEFKQKKLQIRSDLYNLDGSIKGASNVGANKKILFSDDEVEVDNTPKTKAKKVKLLASSGDQNSQKAGGKKQKLIDSSSDEDSETENAEKAKTFQMLENKINMNEKKANQLLHLKTKYSNEDGRFKIDDRFVDGSDSSATSSSEGESASEEEEGNEKEGGEKKERKPKKVISDESMKKKLKKETQASLDILASITGKTVRKPVDPNAEDKKSDKPVLTNKMVRYDPTKTEHKIFELLSDNDEAYESTITKLKSKKKEQANKEAANLMDAKKNVDLTKYTKIEANLKELFQSSDVFQFKFDNIAESLPKNTEWDKPTKLLENKFQKHFNFDNTHQDSSDNSDNDEEHFKHLNKKPAETTTTTNKRQMSEVVVAKNTTLNGDVARRPVNAQRRFLPVFEEDNQLKDALSYFCCVKDIEELRKEWKVSRETMVEEYKKKHKRMLRIQKTKDNEKVMTWRFKKKG